MPAFGILCPCGTVIIRPDAPTAWLALNAHQETCGERTFQAYEAGSTVDAVRSRLQRLRMDPT